MSIKKLTETIKSFSLPYEYQMNTRELDAIMEMAGCEAFYSAVYAFRYGYIKGQRAAKAEARRERRNSPSEIRAGGTLISCGGLIEISAMWRVWKR